MTWNSFSSGCIAIKRRRSGPFGYNFGGFHPLHTAVVEATKASFGNWHQDYNRWNYREFGFFVEKLWNETIRLTTKQYDVCQPRTHSDRPPNNTPLMLLAKWGSPQVSDEVQERMITALVFDGGGGPGLVDNRGMNAPMHAAGVSNKTFFKWFFNRAVPLKNAGFNWDQRNEDGRNVLGLVLKLGADPEIRAMCVDLEKRKLLTRVDGDEGSDRQSTANRRNRGRSKSTKAVYRQRVVNPLSEREWWHHRQLPQSSTSSSSWQPQPKFGSASGIGNPAVYAAPPCASPDDIPIVNV